MNRQEIAAEGTAATLALREISNTFQKLANRWTAPTPEQVTAKNAATRRYNEARRAYYAEFGESLNVPA